MSELNFDRWQFDGRMDRPVSAESRIDWSDYRRMGTKESSVPMRFEGYVPAFAMNDGQLRAVILECERRNSFARGGEEAEKHRQSVARAGGYRAFVCAIAYRAWRLRQDSIAIAEQMDIPPVNVRQHLFRMTTVARVLGFEVATPRKQKEFTPSELRARRNARRETMRRRLYGSPTYIEGTHCWECRIRLIDHTTNKWRCDVCLEKARRLGRSYRRERTGRGRGRRRKSGMPK